MGIFRFLFSRKNNGNESSEKTTEKIDTSLSVEPSEEADFNVKSLVPQQAKGENATEKRSKSNTYGGSFEIKKSKDGRFVFNLYAANKVIIATSQTYSSSQSALTGVSSVIANAEKAAIEDQTLKNFTPQSFPKWEIYIDKAGQFRFRLLATNGSCVCHSQGYTQKTTCKKGIESIIRTVKSAEIDKSYLKK